METTLIYALVVLVFVLWFWAIIDISRSKFKSQSMNAIWLVAVLLFPILGSIFYFQLRRKYVTREKKGFQPYFNQRN